MTNYSDENEIMMSTGLDMTALSPKSQRRLMQYMDQEGEAAFHEMINIRRVVAVSNYAIAAQVVISQNAMLQSQAAPYATEEIADLVRGAHRKLCSILGDTDDSDYKGRY